MRVVRNSSLEERRHCTAFVKLKMFEDYCKKIKHKQNTSLNKLKNYLFRVKKIENSNLDNFLVFIFSLLFSYHFHVIVNDGIIFLCMADEDFGKRQPYAFLEEVSSIGEGLQEIMLNTSCRKK